MFYITRSTTNQAQTLLGFRGAASRSRFFGDNASYAKTQGDTSFQQQSKPLLGTEFGLFAILPLKGRWLALQPEVNMVRAKAGIDWVHNLPDYTQDANATYTFRAVQVPVLLRLSAGSKRLRVFALAGPYANYSWAGRFDIKTRVIDKDDGDQSGIAFSRNLDFKKDSLRHLDAGLMFGAGATAKFGPIWLGFDLRYRAGFREVFYTNSSGIANGVPSRLQAFSPSMFIMIPIRRSKD